MICYTQIEEFWILQSTINLIPRRHLTVPSKKLARSLPVHPEKTETNQFIGTEGYSFDKILVDMISKTLDSGKYAVFTHKGKINTLHLTYDYIWGTWVLCSGFEIDQRDDFEFYDERFLGPDNDFSELDIYIAIK